jgi:hypothetical protein
MTRLWRNERKSLVRGDRGIPLFKERKVGHPRFAVGHGTRTRRPSQEARKAAAALARTADSSAYAALGVGMTRPWSNARKSSVRGDGGIPPFKNRKVGHPRFAVGYGTRRTRPSQEARKAAAARWRWRTADSSAYAALGLGMTRPWSNARKSLVRGDRGIPPFKERKVGHPRFAVGYGTRRTRPSQEARKAAAARRLWRTADSSAYAALGVGMTRLWSNARKSLVRSDRGIPPFRNRKVGHPRAGMTTLLARCRTGRRSEVVRTGVR